MRPLASLKVLDFSTLLPGPYGTLLLADLGAEVLRIESPTRPDLVRTCEPPAGADSAAHRYLNRSKRSLALDLKRPGAIALVKQLVADHDIVVEQFRPGVMARLGIGYDALAEVNPRLIFCSITGYGQDGPYRDRAGHDLNYLALAGVGDQFRRRKGLPVPLGLQLADLAGGSLHAVIGLLAAVVERHETGRGQRVDISMTDAAFAMNALAGPSWLGAGVAPAPEAGWLNGGTHYDYYPTRDGRTFAVGSLEPQFVAALCDAFGAPERAAGAIEPGRRREFKRWLGEQFGSRDFDQLQALFAARDACVEPVLTLPEAAEHPQLRARGMVVEVGDDAAVGERQLGCPIRLSGSEPNYRFPGRAPGADRAAVLEELGIDAQAASRLAADGVFG